MTRVACFALGMSTVFLLVQLAIAADKARDRTATDAPPIPAAADYAAACRRAAADHASAVGRAGRAYAEQLDKATLAAARAGDLDRANALRAERDRVLAEAKARQDALLAPPQAEAAAGPATAPASPPANATPVETALADARFGNTGAWADVTGTLRRLLRDADGRFETRPSLHVTLGADPQPGQVKLLEMRFPLAGGDRHLVVAVPDNQKLFVRVEAAPPAGAPDAPAGAPRPQRKQP